MRHVSAANTGPGMMAGLTTAIERADRTETGGRGTFIRKDTKLQREPGTSAEMLRRQVGASGYIANEAQGEAGLLNERQFRW